MTRKKEVKKVEVEAKEEPKPKVERAFLNPFDKGVSYKDFLRSLPNGKTATKHLEGKCTDEELKWLEIELKNFKSK